MIDTEKIKMLLESWEEANINLLECLVTPENRLFFLECFSEYVMPIAEKISFDCYVSGEFGDADKIYNFAIYKDLLNKLFRNHRIIRIDLNEYYSNEFMFLLIEFIPTREIFERFDFEVMDCLKTLIRKYKKLYESEKTQLKLFK